MISEDKWLEISMLVDGELAEAVAEVLSRFIPAGVVIESHVSPGPEDQGPGSPELWRVTGYLPVNEQVEALKEQITEALWYLGRIKELPDPEFQTVQQVDWSEAWKKNYRPIPVGRHLLIAPSWVEPEPEGRVVIRIDPGMAFGTGTHPTTKLSLEFLEAEVVSQPSMFDIGCGSGILAIAAIKLGVQGALGVDLDRDAISAAHTNAELNEVTQQLSIIQGSVSEVLAQEPGSTTAPLVVANIIAPVLLKLLDQGLTDLVAPQGRLILSGILQEQAQTVLDSTGQLGLQLVQTKEEGDWVALLLKKP